jgi:hypothetical protein
MIPILCFILKVSKKSGLHFHLHHDIWGHGDPDLQNSFLVGLMKQQEVKQKLPQNAEKCRSCSITYEVCLRKEGKNSIKNCKEAFPLSLLYINIETGQKIYKVKLVVHKAPHHLLTRGESI